MDDFQGYQPDFLGTTLQVPLPTLPVDKRPDMAPELTYTHFSVYLSKARRFPYFTATNINGELFTQINRDAVFDSGNDEWRIDDRAKGMQWGSALYTAPKSDFHRGHMTKREDPQWGSTPDVARRAAQDTFHFSNCVPQVAELNTEAWGDLERYILAKRAVKEKKLVSVFTGPVLSADDPSFVTKISLFPVLLPTFFWKVVYYTNDDEQLNRAAFMMGQREALLRRAVIKDEILTHLREFKVVEMKRDYFADYADAALYQVQTGIIEKLTNLRFPLAHEQYGDTRPLQLIFDEVQVSLLEQATAIPHHAFDNIVL